MILAINQYKDAGYRKMLCLMNIDMKALFFLRKDNNSLKAFMAGNDRSLVNGYFLCVLD